MILAIIFFFFASLLISMVVNPEKRWTAFVILAVSFFLVVGKKHEILIYLSLAVTNFILLLFMLKKEKTGDRRLKFFPLVYSVGFILANNQSFKVAGWSYLVLSASTHMYNTLSSRKINLKNWTKEHLFLVTSFPRAFMGPIDRGIISIFSDESRKLGSFRFLQGLIKVGILLNVFRAHVPKPAIVSGASFLVDIPLFFLLGLWHYLDLYLEFSGVIDMVIGIYLIWGFELKENFNNPWLATSITDFWRRWHMTLGKWIMDHIYIPLGGNRHGVARQSINLILAMVVCGLWHGRTANFLIWGGLQGVGLCAEKLLWHFNVGYNKWPIILTWMITQTFVVFSWVIFFNWT